MVAPFRRVGDALFFCSDDGIIANQLIQFVKAGERNPDQLCESALNKLREHLFGD